MSQDTLRVVEKRRHMKMKENWVNIRKLNGEIQRGIRKDKKTYLKKNARCWNSTIKKVGQKNDINR
jgi:hypothetical protein